MGYSTTLLGKRAKLSQRRRVVTLIICLQALLVVLPPCRGGKHQEQQCGEDAFHAIIEPFAGGGVNGGVGKRPFHRGGLLASRIGRQMVSI